jgi:hypothetical protein
MIMASDSLDIIIVYTILGIFIIVGIVTPFINNEFGSSYNSGNIETVGSEMSGTNIITGFFTIMISILSMVLWSFGSLPLWFELIIIEPMRITLYLIVAKWIRGV